MIYVLGLSVSLLVAFMIVLVVSEVLGVIDHLRSLGARRMSARKVRLSRIRYLVHAGDSPGDVIVRRTPFPAPDPTPVFDGAYRKPWGW